jgi:transposase-like protein
MKYKQKLEQTKQTSTEDSQSPAWKQQELNLDSTVSSQESTRLEAVGQTHTKDCIRCGVALQIEVNWISSMAIQRKYICNDCRLDWNKTRMYVNGKYISFKHPLYKPGKYKSFGDAAFESLDNYKTAKQGQVYILYSPAYPSWVKIGMAVDAEDRLKQFQTGSPYRDYILIKAYDTDDRRKAESEIHELLRKTHGNKNEWFVIAAPVAKEILDGYFDENN